MTICLSWWSFREGTGGGGVLEDSIGAYDRREVLVLAESGYDNTKIEKAMADHGWNCILALRKTRSVTAEALALTPPQSQP